MLAGTGTILAMDQHNSADSRRVSVGLRIVLVLVGLAMIFGVVLVVELATGSRTPTEGAELLHAPDPMIPATVEGFAVGNDPDAASFLEQAYRKGNVPVTRVEAALIGSGSAKGRLSAARVDREAGPATKQFRGNILLGAAAGYGVEAAQFSYRVRDGIAVYTLTVSEGRLFVWFFSDSFVQLFVPASIGDKADAMFEAVLGATRSEAGSVKVIP